MYDRDYHQQQPASNLTAVIRNVRPPARWAPAGAYLIGVTGIVLAAATLTLFLLWKGSVAAQVTQLRNEVTAAQDYAQAQASSAGSALSGLSGRVAGLRHDVDTLNAQAGPFTTICTTDLTGPNGPAAYLFPCTQKP